MGVHGLVAQCGGPTPVVNATLAAAIAAWQAAPHTGRLWGSRFGMHGLVHGNWTELTHLPPATLAALHDQPGAALGSSRYRARSRDIPTLIERLAAARIGVLLLIGGNGTMAAAHAIHQAAVQAGYDQDSSPLRVIGIPKTVDNDLAETYAAPGYGSAARFVAETTRGVGLDLRSMAGYDQVVVLEVMGRHTGWLAAASALARSHPGDPPHLILLPETPFDEPAFLHRVQTVQRSQGVCLVIAAEGVRDQAGNYLAEKQRPADRDASDQRMLGLSAGVAPYLAGLVRERLGLICRQLRPDTIQRSSRALVAPVDRHLAALCGSDAVAAALDGFTGVMIGVVRGEDGWQTQPVALEAVIGRERSLPPDFCAPTTFGITAACLDYLRPLVGDLSPAPILL